LSPYPVKVSELRPANFSSESPAEERVIVPDVVPAIITAEERAAVMARLRHNQATSIRNNRCPEGSLLRAGFVRCGHRGRSLVVTNPTGSRPTASPTYRCDRRQSAVRGCPEPSIAASLLDPLIWEGVCALLLDPTVIYRALCTHYDGGGLTRELAVMEQQLQTIVTEQQRTARRIATIEDDAVAAPLLAELHTLASSRTWNGCGTVSRIRQRTPLSPLPDGVVSDGGPESRRPDLRREAVRPGGARHAGPHLSPGQPRWGGKTTPAVGVAH
jgi:Recombinase zinc beta ribbon domain